MLSKLTSIVDLDILEGALAVIPRRIPLNSSVGEGNDVLFSCRIVRVEIKGISVKIELGRVVRA
jgi:hypothetical protein